MEISIRCSPTTMKYLRRLFISRHLLLPVALNMLLTLFCWVGIYDMKIDEKLVNYMFGNSGENLMDAMKNGMFSALAFFFVAATMLAFAMFDFRRLVQFWLYTSCILLLYIISGFFFYATIVGPEVDLEQAGNKPFKWVVLLTICYGTTGCIAYFTDLLPSWVHRVYVVCNCSLLSQYYLRCLPGYTAWIVVVTAAIWEAFSNLSSVGPINLIQQKAADYSAKIMRFLMFTYADEPEQRTDSSSSEASHTGSSEDILDKERKEKIYQHILKNRRQFAAPANDQVLWKLDLADGCSPVLLSTVPPSTLFRNTSGQAPRTAADVWNDDGEKLGMGDFIFYGVLVGKAATSGSLFATASAFFGVLIGLSLTLAFSGPRYAPALPLSVFLGIMMHLMTLQMEPLVHSFLHAILDVLVV